jgi:predicted nucleotidyltransferase
LPDKAAKDIAVEWFLEGENIRVADAFVVDIMLNANGFTFDDLAKYREVIDLDGVQVSTINLEGLLLTKKTSRDKDAIDRIVIERALDAIRQQPSTPAP